MNNRYIIAIVLLLLFCKAQARSDSSITELDETMQLSLELPTSCTAQYNQNVMRIDFGYDTNMPELCNATPLNAIKLPTEYVKISGTDDFTGEYFDEIPVSAAEYHNDGYLYMWIDEEESFDYYEDVKVSFINPEDEKLQLKYEDIENNSETVIPNISNLLASFDENLYALSIEQMPPTVVSIEPFGPNDSVISVSFNKNIFVNWENPYEDTTSLIIIAVSEDGISQDWIPDCYNEDTFTVNFKPRSPFVMYGEYTFYIQNMRALRWGPSNTHVFSMSFPKVNNNGYTQVGSTDLFYKITSNIDVQGYYNNKYYRSTFADNGYKVAMQVDNNQAVMLDCMNGTLNNGVMFRAYIIEQGGLARICYLLTNTNTSDVSISLGVHADVMIGNNDRAPISRRIDTFGNTYGLTMRDGVGAQLCVLFGNGLTGVTGVNDYWFGHYSLNSRAIEMVGNYWSGSNYMQENGSYDSGMGWCWKNRSIASGETIVLSWLIGVGDVVLEPNSSFEVTPEDPDGWNDLSRPHRLALNGLYESPAGLSGLIEYSVENSEEWMVLTDTLESGDTFNASLVATFNPNRSKHIIRFRTRDLVGNTTLLHPIEYIDVSYHAVTNIKDMVYTGDSIFQTNLVCDLDTSMYVIKNYSGNVNAGTATFSIEGVFPYTIGRKEYTFQINPAKLTGSLNLSSDCFVYNGEEHLPVWSFTNDNYETLEENKDYNVSYIDNIYPGTGKVRIVGKGNYTSELEKSFFIDKAHLNDELYTITLPAEDIIYDENEHKAIATSMTGVGEIKFTYTLHGETEVLQNTPIDAGSYDIYCEIADGEYYYGKANEYLASFAIYKFDESEWQSIGVLYTELQQMDYPVTWNIEGGVKCVGTFEGLRIEKGHVVGIALANKGITGLFPGSLMSFQKLENINLSNNNLYGDIAIAMAALKKQNPLAFNSLKVLDISNNSYSGNIGILASCMSNLTSLNVSNNQFEDLFPALSSSIKNLDISNQKMDRVVTLNVSDMSFEDIKTKIPTILLYNQKNNSYNNSINLLCTKADLESFNKYDTEEWAIQLQSVDNKIFMPYISAQNAYYGESGDTLNVLNMIGDDITDGSSFKVALSFNQGDANFINGVDATDLQTTILYAFGGYRQYPFNFTAADTYKDGLINVQDIICTVNIILDSNNESVSEARINQVNRAGMIAEASPVSDAYMYINDGKIFLHTRVPVAALSIKAEGNVKWNFERFGMIQSASNGNVVAYSLNGTTISSYEDVILGECSTVMLNSVSLSDADAQPISVSFIDNKTNISNTLDVISEDTKIYDVSGNNRNTLGKGINIVRSNGTTKKILKK